MRIIGIAGKMGVGKTTLANELVKSHGFVRRAFADALKEEVYRVYGIDGYGDKNAIVHLMNPPDPIVDGQVVCGMTLRELLQWYGTEYRRAQNPNYWNDKMREYIQGLPPDAKLVIDDVRFLDEVELIKSLGGLVVRLAPYPSWKPGANSDHVSETALDKIPFLTWAPPCDGVEYVEIFISNIDEP